MSKNLDQIKEAIPEAVEQGHIKALAEDLDKAQLLRNVLESEGGDLLIKALRDDATAVLTHILKEVKDPLVFKLEANLNLLTTLQSAKDREKSLQEILDAELKAITS
jgi:flagellar biosynthesis/type III secretory pathway chaperone